MDGVTIVVQTFCGLKEIALTVMELCEIKGGSQEMTVMVG